jgi:predicted PurR-regulated permease PerM
MEATRLVRIALVALLALGCILILQPFIAAILFAAVICVTTWPLYARLLQRIGNRPVLAALLMVLLLMLVVVLPMGFLAASLTDLVPELVEKINALIDTPPPSPPEWLNRLPLVGALIQDYWEHAAASSEEISKVLRQFYEPARGLLLKSVVLAGQGLLQLVAVLFIAFFFYRDGEALIQRLRALGHRLGGELGGQMLLLARNTVMGVMIGIVGTAFAQALVALVGFLIAGVPAAAVLAAATFFLSMVPVGPPLVWGGAAFWLFDQGEPGWAAFMAIWGLLAISSVDNLVKPILISRTASLPILLIALGVFGGVLAFGFVGIFLGPTLLALGLVLTEKYTSHSHD